MLFFGDSHTSNDKNESWAPHVAALFSQEHRNFAKGGHTSHETLAAVRKAIPLSDRFAFLYTGNNDHYVEPEVIASSLNTEQSFQIQGHTRLRVGGIIRIRKHIVEIAEMKKGFVTLRQPLPFRPVGGTRIEIARAENIAKIVRLLKSQNVEHIFVLGAHYRNFSATERETGDFMEHGFLEQRKRMRGLRTAQAEAARAMGVPYIDLVRLFSDEITAGRQTQGDTSLHTKPGNGHLSPAGKQAMIGDRVADWLRAEDYLASPPISAPAFKPEPSHRPAKRRRALTSLFKLRS
ncbi:SGNH/GDSL hydrolase family protein [Algicella marina]|nr:SGNH/GDSL hydrolase family protein [Algicella marina]